MQLCWNVHSIWIEYSLFSHIRGLPQIWVQAESKKALHNTLLGPGTPIEHPSQNSLPILLLAYKCKSENQKNQWKENQWNAVFMMRFSLLSHVPHLKSIKVLARRIFPLDHQRDMSILFSCWAMVLLISPPYTIWEKHESREIGLPNDIWDTGAFLC